MLLGIVIVVFCVVVGSIELSSSYGNIKPTYRPGVAKAAP